MYSGTPGLIWTPEKSLPVLKSEDMLLSQSLNQVDIVQRETDLVSKEYSAISPELIATTSQLLPDAIDTLKLRNEVLNIGNKSGIAIKGLAISPITNLNSPKLGAYKVSFNLSSKYPPFKELMRNYEKSTRLFIIESMTINRITDEELKEKSLNESKANIVDLEETLNIQVTFRVHYLK
jgi:hypothetical protein